MHAPRTVVLAASVALCASTVVAASPAVAAAEPAQLCPTTSASAVLTEEQVAAARALIVDETTAAVQAANGVRVVTTIADGFRSTADHDTRQRRLRSTLDVAGEDGTTTRYREFEDERSGRSYSYVPAAPSDKAPLALLGRRSAWLVTKDAGADLTAAGVAAYMVDSLFEGLDAPPDVTCTVTDGAVRYAIVEPDGEVPGLGFTTALRLTAAGALGSATATGLGDDEVFASITFRPNAYSHTLPATKDTVTTKVWQSAVKGVKLRADLRLAGTRIRARALDKANDAGRPVTVADVRNAAKALRRYFPAAATTVTGGSQVAAKDPYKGTTLRVKVTVVKAKVVISTNF